MNGLTEALHIEWAKHGIRVTAVKPPLVNTAMGHAVGDNLSGKFRVDMQPEHVAEAIELAISGNASRQPATVPERRSTIVTSIVLTIVSIITVPATLSNARG